MFLGATLALAFLKFGNPVILDRLVANPTSGWEWIFQPWPVRWGHLLLGLCLLLGLGLGPVRTWAPRWLLVLPAAWLLWQAVSAVQTVATALTVPTMFHFVACLLCFYLGAYRVAGSPGSGRFGVPLLVGLLLVLWTGFEQHYGGLEATRQMFYAQPDWQSSPPELLKKIQSNRIFATLVYPNALATAILLLLPLSLVTVWKWTTRLSLASRAVVAGVVAYMALACLLWSGSKSGWLIGLVLLIATLLSLPVSKRLKIGILLGLLVVGLAGFFVRYAGYFKRGAPSVSARFEYWKAAVQTAKEQPILGTGPGTFSVAYRQVIPPGAEMAQLTHNDYLEQASDSGIVGLVLYAAFVLGSLVFLPLSGRLRGRPERLAAWIGCLGWGLQSFVEFPLYIPAVAWTAFTFLGWLWGSPPENNRFDSVGRVWYGSGLR